MSRLRPPRSWRPARAVRRWYVHQRTDVYLVSMPKAGRTWLRVLLGRIAQQRSGAPLSMVLRTPHLHRIDPAFPAMGVSHDGYRPGMAPEDVRQSKRRYRNKRVILLVRDPRDVVVSLYHQDRHRRQHGIGGNLRDRVRGRADGLSTVIEFYNSWSRARDVPRALLVVRYEDLQREPVAELRRVVDFLGMSVQEDVLREAVAFAAFDNMRQLEAADALGAEALRPGDAHEPASYKVRRGRIGGYRHEFSERDVAELDRMVREGLSGWYRGYA